MGCSCQKPRDDINRDEVLKPLEAIDFRDIAEHATVIPDTTTSAIRYLEKAERAERLGLGADVATLYRQAAERDRAQGIRQFRAVIARLDERTGRDDWAELVDRSRREFEERDGPALVEEARGRLRLAVLEMDGVSADDAGMTASVFDESVDRALAGGLDGVARLLRERLERGLEALQSPEMGRQHASPQTESQLICIGIFSAMAVVQMIACGVATFCWCCIGWLIMAWLAAMIALCWAAA
jgi:hypothetical protein